MIFSFDLSLRSTGACCFDRDSGALVDFTLVINKELNDEELFIWNVNKLLDFIDENCRRTGKEPVGFVTEDLALHAISADKDKIWGQFWYLQCKLKEVYGWVPRGRIPVTSWRSYILTKKEQREAKTTKDGLKQAVFDKLPGDWQVRIMDYLEEHRVEINVAKGLNPESKSKEYLKARYDLGDAASLGLSRLSLENY